MSTVSSNSSNAPLPPSTPAGEWPAWGGVIFIIAVFFAAQVLAGLAVSLYPLARHWSSGAANQWLNSSVYGQFVFVLLAEGLVLLAVYWWLRHYRSSWSAIGLKRPRWSDAGYALIAAPVYYFLAWLALLLTKSLVPAFNPNETQQVGFNNVQGTLPLILTFISLAVLPPLTEEIMVRGLLYGSLKRAVPIVYAVLTTSALFAAAHLDEGANGLLWTAGVSFFVLSLVLIFLREKTGSLWASIGVHAINNTVAFVALYLVH